MVSACAWMVCARIFHVAANTTRLPIIRHIKRDSRVWRHLPTTLPLYLLLTEKFVIVTSFITIRIVTKNVLGTYTIRVGKYSETISNITTSIFQSDTVSYVPYSWAERQRIVCVLARRTSE